MNKPMSNLVFNIEARTLAPVSIVAPPAEGSKATGQPTMPRGDGETAYIPRPPPCAASSAEASSCLLPRPLPPKASRGACRGFTRFCWVRTPRARRSPRWPTSRRSQRSALQSPCFDLFGVGLTLSGGLIVSRLLPVENVAPTIITGTSRDLGDDESVI
jgi:hypothetical protein